MKQYQQDFITFAKAHDALKFGDFTLKSGRKSHYFFNAGVFNTGDALSQLGRFYAAAIHDANFDYDLLFGPAYKGIPIVCSTAIALAEQYDSNKPVCFNRKEAKDHGEGGHLVGAPLQGNVLLVDDVITVGTAIRESAELIVKSGASLCGIVVALDRQEVCNSDVIASEEIAQEFNVPVVSIIKMEDLGSKRQI